MWFDLLVMITIHKTTTVECLQDLVNEISVSKRLIQGIKTELFEFIRLIGSNK